MGFDSVVSGDKAAVRESKLFRAGLCHRGFNVERASLELDVTLTSFPIDIVHCIRDSIGLGDKWHTHNV